MGLQQELQISSQARALLCAVEEWVRIVRPGSDPGDFRSRSGGIVSYTLPLDAPFFRELHFCFSDNTLLYRGMIARLEANGVTLGWAWAWCGAWELSDLSFFVDRNGNVWIEWAESLDRLNRNTLHSRIDQMRELESQYSLVLQLELEGNCERGDLQ
jgi:hypothetical protein